MERITTYYLFGIIPLWTTIETLDPTYIPEDWVNDQYEEGGYE